jgi:hypothetical protein
MRILENLVIWSEQVNCSLILDVFPQVLIHFHNKPDHHIYAWLLVLLDSITSMLYFIKVSSHSDAFLSINMSSSGLPHDKMLKGE